MAPNIAGLPFDEIVNKTGEIYMRRHYQQRHRDGRSVRYHHILLPDEDPDMHDHPWDFTTTLIHGTYTEHTPTGTFTRTPGDTITHLAPQPHRLDLTEPVWTQVVTSRVYRPWGFHTNNGWIPWRTYPSNPTTTSRQW